MKYSFIFIATCVLLLSASSRTVDFHDDGNKFAFTLLNIISKENPDSNFVFSPYGLRNGFAFVYPGVNNRAKAEIKEAFLFQDSPKKILDNFRQSDSTFRGCTKSKVSLANSMWFDKNYLFSKKYLTVTTKYTNAVRPLEGVTNVNNWVTQKTNGKIKELIVPSDLVDTKLLLVSAIALDAEWKFPFDSSKTYKGEFWIHNKKKIVTMMNSEVGGKFFDMDTSIIVQLPYKDDLKMTIFMPKQEGAALNWSSWVKDWLRKSVEYKPRSFNQIIHGREDRFILHLPKFTLSTSINFVPLLRKMGVKEPFNKMTEDLEPMSPTKKLFIGVVKQKAGIEVKESGTKATAATAIAIKERSMPQEVKIDRPFYFVIHHPFTGDILFMGRVMDPTKQ